MLAALLLSTALAADAGPATVSNTVTPQSRSKILQFLGVVNSGWGTSHLMGLAKFYGNGRVVSPSMYEGISRKTFTPDHNPFEIGLYVGQSLDTEGGASFGLSGMVHATLLDVFGIGLGTDFYKGGGTGPGFGAQKFDKNHVFFVLTGSTTNTKSPGL